MKPKYTLFKQLKYAVDGLTLCSKDSNIISYRGFLWFLYFFPNWWYSSTKFI